MTLLLNDAPLTPNKHSLSTFKGLKFPVYPYEACLQVSLSPKGTIELPKIGSAFPAVIDTGTLAPFVIGQRQLEVWTGLNLSAFGSPQAKGNLRLGSGDVVKNLLRYNLILWVHSNLPQVAPHRFFFHAGLVVYPANQDKVCPFPLIGREALVRGRMACRINYETLTFSLETYRP